MRKRHRRLALLVTPIVLLGAGVIITATRTPPPHLTAVDRATGTLLWRTRLPHSGAYWVSKVDEQLLVRICRPPYVDLLVDIPSGTIVGEQAQGPHLSPVPFESPEYGRAVIWNDPGPNGFGLPVAEELRFDRAVHTLVSTEGWRVKVATNGPNVHIPVLIAEDAVYFIENVGACFIPN